jgi:formylglycine-generating enzyme required for sulfatase activity
MADGTLGPELVILAGSKLAMQRFEVTRAEFKRFWQTQGGRLFAGKEPSCRDRESIFRSSHKRTWENPDIDQTDNHPVVCISWQEAAIFAKWLSKETGKHYRLPAPAEWEQVARKSAPADCKTANLADAAFKRKYDSHTGSDCDDGYAATAPVGRFETTAGGVYDMDGNVREWVGACGNGAAAEAGSNCRDFMVKGRGWLSQAGKESVSVSDSFADDVALNSLGFRLVRDLDK